MPARFESDSVVMERFYKSHARHILRDQKATINECTEATFPLGTKGVLQRKSYVILIHLKTRFIRRRVNF